MSLDLEFGFNDANFSDRILCIAILPDDDKPTTGSKPGMDDDCRKALRDIQLQNSQGEASLKNETSPDHQHYSAFQNKNINVNSLILAGHSQFFHKLFSNGMKESANHRASIHVQASEEDAFMDMLKFMYSGKLSRPTSPELLQVLRVADKFSVASCVNHCIQLLNNLPMTLELALAYLDIDSTGLMVDFVKQSLDKAREFLVEHFKDMTLKGNEFKEELIMLPLAGVEAVLSSDCLRILSEDIIYDFIQKWVQTHYADQLEEKRKMLSMLLRRYLRFPYISNTIVKNILSSRDIDHEVASEIALGSLSYHLGQPPQQHSLSKFVKRDYKCLCLKVVAFDDSSSQPQCTVFLDLKRVECEKMVPRSRRFSQNFFLGEHELALCAGCWINEQFSFGLHFAARTPDISKTIGLTFSCEIAYMEKSSEDFVVSFKGKVVTMPKSDIWGWKNVFSTTWERFISEDSPYFIDDILRLRFHLRILN